jgi:hypothetical protein
LMSADWHSSARPIDKTSGIEEETQTRAFTLHDT